MWHVDTLPESNSLGIHAVVVLEGSGSTGASPSVDTAAAFARFVCSRSAKKMRSNEMRRMLAMSVMTSEELQDRNWPLSPSLV